MSAASVRALGRPLFHAALAVLLTGSISIAGEYYVDAHHGDDAAAGVSLATAWRTIAHAVAATPPSGPQTIYIAPGVYDTASGEAFPIDMRPELQLVGDRGSAVTILDGGGATSLISMYQSATVNSAGFGATCCVRGLSLRHAQYGLSIQTAWGTIAPQLTDVRIAEMSIAGIYAGSFLSNGGSAPCSPHLDHVEISGNATGLMIRIFSNTGVPSGSALVLADCTISGNFAAGISLLTSRTSATVTIDRCRITSNGADGVDVKSQALGAAAMTMLNTLVAKNGGSGVLALASQPSGGVPSVSMLLTSSTIADNFGEGVSCTAVGGISFLTMKSCILAGNGDDVFATGSTFVSRCDIGGGDFAGTNGNIAVDPRFCAAASGDYRLKWGSACIDAGEPSQAGVADLAGNERPFDGDLDTQALPDMGAIEFETLRRRGGTSPGSRIGLEIWGSAGASSSLLFSPLPLVAAQSTPFGALRLDRSSTMTLSSFVIPAESFSLLRRKIQNDPSLIGRTFSMQALTDSSAAPQGKAYSNPITFVIEP